MEELSVRWGWHIVQRIMFDLTFTSNILSLRAQRPGNGWVTAE